MRNHLLYDSRLDESGAYWNEIMPEIRAIDGAFFVTGTLGLWDGPRHVWGIFKTLNAAIQTMYGECDAITITESYRGKCEVQAYHHDGVNTFELRRLNGIDWETEASAMRHSTNANLRREMGWI